MTTTIAATTATVGGGTATRFRTLRAPGRRFPPAGRTESLRRGREHGRSGGRHRAPSRPAAGSSDRPAGRQAALRQPPAERPGKRKVKQMNELSLFLGQLARRPGQVVALAPSSRALARRMAEAVPAGPGPSSSSAPAPAGSRRPCWTRASPPGTSTASRRIPNSASTWSGRIRA